MNLVNDQVRISGEILGMDVRDPSNAGSLGLTTSYQSLDSLSIIFTSDRTGYVEIDCHLCVEKITSGSVEAVYFELVDSENRTLDEKVGKAFHSSDGLDVVRISFMLSVSANTSYEYRLRAKSSSNSTFVAYWGGQYPLLMMKVVGL
ncbi:MAG: hypothetical protein ACR2M6_02750 [Vampirovibrionia bacterium]